MATKTDVTGPKITEETPTGVTTETVTTSVEEKPAIVSTVADVMTAIDPFVKRLESLEVLFSNSNLVERLDKIEQAVQPLLEEAKQIFGKGTFTDRIKRLEQIIAQHFGAHQLSTAQPVEQSKPQ